MGYPRIGAAGVLVMHLAAGHAETELVMQANTGIEARQDGAAIQIFAGKKFDRSYAFDGCTLHSNMGARGGRWFGSLGIYDPAGSFNVSFLAPKGCHGIHRTVVEEGQMHFDDLQFAQEWIRRQQRAAGQTGKVVWSNDGLLVAWTTVPARAQLNAGLWLICINGQRPTLLEGARDNAIKVITRRSSSPFHTCAQVTPEVIAQTRKQLEDDWKMTDRWIADHH
jgi:hypothetical protein